MLFFQTIDIFRCTILTVFNTLLSVFSLFQQVTGIRTELIAIAIGVAPLVVVMFCYFLKFIRFLWRV